MSEIDQPKILSENLFPVVGIGASAGGLEAFKKFIKAIPDESGMAYILVQHLHPEHESVLPEILQRLTKIPVLEISDNVVVKVDHIYVIPSNKMLVATDGILKLSPRLSKNKQNLPIDLFFSSLAEVHQSHAIGVILSGTGSDGTAGLKDIKDNGGITFAQEPASALYGAMPQHAIDAEVIDFILPVDMIPGKLLELKQSFNVIRTEDETDAKGQPIEDQFRQILQLIKTKLGVDFTFYKQTTIRRRIMRRALILKLESVAQYLVYLKKNEDEKDTLFQDLLIPVTAFFRDPDTFDALCKTVFPDILKNKSTENPMRIWVAGCSCGQEVYSIAMCVLEFLSNEKFNNRVQVFATDISEKSIKKARSGIYSKKEMEGVSENRLQQFFDTVDGEFHVKKQLRDMCVFAVHNFLKDPPFSKIDLITCRNVLIYFEPYLQKKALGIFNYALNEKGVLLLGRSETTSSASELFTPITNTEKYYRRKSLPGRFRITVDEQKQPGANGKTGVVKQSQDKADDFKKIADDILLSKFTPVGVIVNEHFDIVQFRGSTGDFLEPSPGKASLNVLKMAREGLAFEIRNALHKAKTTNTPFSKHDIPINHGKKLVTIEVIPMHDTIELHFLILFSIDTPGNRSTVSENKKLFIVPQKKNPKDIRIHQLEKELAGAREDMFSITEVQETANQELQSTNEELLSGSEELQSLNEELETSKEELQSTNEELITVNQELYDSNDQLNQSRKSAEAIIAMLHEPMLVLDNNLNIKSANKSFYKNFRLTEEETFGKNLFALKAHAWNIPVLRRALGKVQKDKEKMVEVKMEFTFPTLGKRRICVNVQAIKSDNGDQLILLALDDITDSENAALLLEENANQTLKQNVLLQSYFMHTPALLHILKGPEHIFTSANSFYQQFIGNRDPTGKRLMDAIPELKGQGVLEIVDQVYYTGVAFTGKEIPVSLKMKNGKLHQHFIDVNYQAIKDDEGNVESIFSFAYDVTERVKARKQLEANAEMIHNLYMNAPGFICTFSGPKHIYTLVNPAYQKLFGKREIVGKPIMEALPELAGQDFDKILDKVYNTGETFVGIDVPITLARDEGLVPKVCYFNFSYQPIYNEDKKITGILVFGYEVTEELLSKQILAESSLRFRILANAMPQKMWTADENGLVNYFNQQWFDYTHKSFADLKDLGWEKIIHPDDWNQNKQTWIQSISSGEEFELEHRFLRHDGVYRWHLSRGLAQKDKDGKVIVWIGTHTDIDEQKVFEKELEKQVKEGIELEKQKNKFISMASHELKTPLTSIKGYTQVLQHKFKGEGNEEVGDYLGRMIKQINKITSLIGDLLDSSKVKEGGLKFDEEVFDFNELVTETIDQMQHTTQSHTIKMKLDASQQVYSDRNRIGQVITNMLSNAIKYSPAATEVIVTSNYNNHQLKLCVQDFGIGIAEDKQSKVFDQFYRVSGEVQDTFPGLGLGMFIASEIIKRSKGEMSVKSAAGKGSTFCFTVPVVN